MSPLVLLALAYLLGAVPTSYWVGRAFYGVDLRTVGSKNLGATNVFRIMGWKAALPVVIVDIAKGFVPVWAFPLLDRPSSVPMWALAYGGAAIVGHVFSVWVRFRGGKGVATSCGVFLGLAPWAVLIAFAVWALTVFPTRLVSLGSLTSAITLPIAIWLTPNDGGTPLLLFSILLAVFVIWAHRTNIGRLRRGEEGKIAPASAPPSHTPPASRGRGDGPR